MQIVFRTALGFALATACWTDGGAQQARPATRPAEAFGKGESARFTASAMAGTRALNLCSGRWQAGLSDEIIERELNGRDPTYGQLAPGAGTDIDQAGRVVTIGYDTALPPRIAAWRPVLGCVLLPVGAARDAIRSLPQVPATFRPPDLDERSWPIGDRAATATLPPARRGPLDAVVAAAFDGRTYGGRTWGVVIVADGRIVAERYAPGFDLHTASQTHSAAKSITATLAGIAVGRGLIDLDRTGILPQWRRPGDPRAAITLRHLLRMSSGLYTDGTASLFKNVYTQGGAVRDLIPTNFLDGVPGTRFVYSPADTMLTQLAIRTVIADDPAYLRFPYEALLWKIGMTHTTMNGDWDGTAYGSGQTWSSARDFARFGLLYLNDGVWQGERILPEGWARFVATRGPAQPAAPPYYGAQFWLHGGLAGLPDDAFSPHGGQGHFAMIVPSRRVVIVRRGFDDQGRFAIDRFSADVLNAIGR